MMNYALRMASVLGLVSVCASGPILPGNIAAASERPAAPALPEGVAQPFYQIDRSQLGTPEWKEAIATAKSHMGRHGGYYSLFRIVFKDPRSAEERVHVEASKLKGMTKEYNGGGGMFREVKHGGFAFIEHGNSSRRRNGRDPVVLNSADRGGAIIELDVPTRGELQVVGDVVIVSDSNETCPNAISPDGRVRRPRIGLLGIDFYQGAMLSGQWRKAIIGEAKEPRLYFFVSKVNGKEFKPPARYERVHAADPTARTLVPVAGETWTMFGREVRESISPERGDAPVQPPPENAPNRIRVVLQGSMATVDRGVEGET